MVETIKSERMRDGLWQASLSLIAMRIVGAQAYRNRTWNN
jgi:hypothetical protein